MRGHASGHRISFELCLRFGKPHFHAARILAYELARLLPHGKLKLEERAFPGGGVDY